MNTQTLRVGEVVRVRSPRKNSDTPTALYKVRWVDYSNTFYSVNGIAKLDLLEGKKWAREWTVNIKSFFLDYSPEILGIFLNSTPKEKTEKATYTTPETAFRKAIARKEKEANMDAEPTQQITREKALQKAVETLREMGEAPSLASTLQVADWLLDEKREQKEGKKGYDLTIGPGDTYYDLGVIKHRLAAIIERNGENYKTLSDLVKICDVLGIQRDAVDKNGHMRKFTFLD